MEDNTIIRDLRVLTEEFIPARIIHRDGQLRALRDSMMPLLQRRPARHAFLFGPPGTGKTCLSRYLLEELKKSAPVVTAYVNCWVDATRFRIFYTLLRGLGAFIHRKGTPTDELFDLFKTKTSGRQCVIILDEIDHLEDETVLYDLLQAGAGLILISNAETALHRIDARIRSRLMAAEQIAFPPYPVNEIADILGDRAAYGLVPATVKRSQLEKIARLCRGDARAALSILSLAAQKAEDANLDAIPDRFIDAVFPALLKDSRRQAMETLSPYQRLAIDLLKEGKQQSGALYAAMNEAAGRMRLAPLEERTYRKHMERLVRKGFASAEGSGRWRIYAVAGTSEPLFRPASDR